MIDLGTRGLQGSCGDPAKPKKGKTILSEDCSHVNSQTIAINTCNQAVTTIYNQQLSIIYL